MSEHTLVHEEEIEFLGKKYRVSVYTSPEGHFFAETRFNDKDIIISDGLSLQETLSRHEGLIPLAVSSRQVLHTTSSNIRRLIPRS